VKAASHHLESLDAFRGLTIAGMILVNSPGNDAAYWPLEHAEWNGCTPTDLIFPFFVLIVGVSLAFSLAGRLERGDSQGDLLRHIGQRTGRHVGPHQFHERQINR
jgi:predicted acyltransferase